MLCFLAPNLDLHDLLGKYIQKAEDSQVGVTLAYDTH